MKEEKLEINLGILMEKVNNIKEAVDEIRQWIKESDSRLVTKDELEAVKKDLDFYKKGLLGVVSAVILWVVNSLLGLIKAVK